LDFVNRLKYGDEIAVFILVCLLSNDYLIIFFLLAGARIPFAVAFFDLFRTTFARLSLKFFRV